MQEITDSDFDLTMLATKSFHHVINEVQSSCLNFQLQISPFSAVISLKKSLIRDMSGKPILPTLSKHDSSKEHIEALEAKNLELEKKLHLLSNIKHEKAVIESNKDSEIKIEATPSILIDQLEEEKSKLEEAIKARDYKICDLKVDNKAAKEASGKLTKALGEMRIKFEKEKSSIQKEHRSEIKTLRKDLGNANSEIFKLEKQLEQHASADSICTPKKSKGKSKNRKVKVEETKETQSNSICSICGLDIQIYIPEYFLGQKYNPTCASCKASDSSWDPDDPFTSFPSSAQPSSLVSHWIPSLVKTQQRPGSIPSMVTHCALLPPPGSSFLSMEEVLVMMKEFFEKPWFKLDVS